MLRRYDFLTLLAIPARLVATVGSVREDTGGSTRPALYAFAVMNRHELMSVTALGRTSLVVAASDGRSG